jgi:3-oxoacyl-[acyl-carrier protein] reductase
VSVLGLRGRIAVVSGAGSGIGRSTAVRLAHEGATVIVNDVDGSRASETLTELPRGDGFRHHAMAADVANSAQVDEMFTFVDEACGGVDLLVCNAAVSRTQGDGRELKDERLRTRMAELAAGREPETHPDQVVDMSDDGWQRMLAINLSGAFYCCRAALRLMNRHNRGSIVCVSSIAAQSGIGPVHYTAAKAALLGLVRSLALEVSTRGIRVNAVCPGSIDTPMMRATPVELRRGLEARIPLGKVGTPDEVAAVICYLLSDDAAYVTGATVPVNGGLFIG